MIYYNNALLTKRELLTRIIKLLKDGDLVDKIDRIPLLMRPKSKHPIRCCVHKDRAVVKYKIMAILGFGASDEKDELTPLSEYAKQAIKRTHKIESFLTVVDEACSSCVQVNYTVSNLCQGCEARACQMNCPKKAIAVINGKAHIDDRMCVNCGICQKACPYHAIAYLPVPCEESCPVKAIKKNEDGIEVIDEAKCIDCGRCLTSCPFGAVIEKTQVIELVQAMQAKQPMVALVAPAFLGQYNASPDKVLGSIKQLGFVDVIEVAQGADVTIEHETTEWMEMMKNGEPYMTTSCCPAYKSLVEKHIPDLKPRVSHTHSPMIYAAQIAKEKYPHAKLVFISPCFAKRKEAFQSHLIDYVLTFEEAGAYLSAYDIEVNESNAIECSSEISVDARSFAMSGGVAQAVANKLADPELLKPELVDGLNKKSIALLKAYAKKGGDFNFVEVMACNGGCVNGPCRMIQSDTVRKNLVQAIETLHPDRIEVQP